MYLVEINGEKCTACTLITSDSTAEGKQGQELPYLKENSIFTGNNRESSNRK